MIMVKKRIYLFLDIEFQYCRFSIYAALGNKDLLELFHIPGHSTKLIWCIFAAINLCLIKWFLKPKYNFLDKHRQLAQSIIACKRGFVRSLMNYNWQQIRSVQYYKLAFLFFVKINLRIVLYACCFVFCPYSSS
jgi:hypothetical protein